MTVNNIDCTWDTVTNKPSSDAKLISAHAYFRKDIPEEGFDVSLFDTNGKLEHEMRQAFSETAVQLSELDAIGQKKVLLMMMCSLVMKIAELPSKPQLELPLVLGLILGTTFLVHLGIQASDEFNGVRFVWEAR